MNNKNTISEKVRKIGAYPIRGKKATDIVIPTTTMASFPATIGAIALGLPTLPLIPAIALPIIGSSVYHALSDLMAIKLVNELKKQGYTPKQAFKNAVKIIGSVSKELDEFKEGLQRDIYKLSAGEVYDIKEDVRDLIEIDKAAIKKLDDIIG